MNEELANKGATYLTKWKDQRPWSTDKAVKAEFDETMLRLYVYDDPEPRENCDLVQAVVEKRTVQKKFPTKFAKAIIVHIITCDNCHTYHQGMRKDGEASST